MRRLGTTLTLALLTTGLLAAPASAATPGNDTRGGATAITTLPYNATLDTTAATTDADDTALNAACGAPFTNASVWYSYTAPVGVAGLVVDVSSSSYSAGVIINQPGVGVIACGPGAVGTLVTPGTTYEVLAFSDSPVNGGRLVLHAEAATVPQVSVTVNPRGKVDRAGNALISGTYTCTGGDFLDLSTSLKQPVGRFAITGDGYTGGACDGTHSWTAQVMPSNGKFAGGKATSFTYAFSCGTVFCSEGYQEQAVKLSR